MPNVLPSSTAIALTSVSLVHNSQWASTLAQREAAATYPALKALRSDENLALTPALKRNCWRAFKCRLMLAGIAGLTLGDLLRLQSKQD